MILFIAPDPHKQLSREGYLQRVAAIDAMFAAHEKIYSENLKSQEELVDVMIDADVIYLHSIYQSEKILSSYSFFADKIITDLHGLVPQELAIMGDEYQHISRHMENVEKTVLSNGRQFVAVSQNMADYYTKKYKLRNTTWIILPIFEIKHVKERVPSRDKAMTAIYAGGTQKWQNIDLMIDAINRAPSDNKYIILTPSPENFVGIKSKRASEVTIKSVPSAEVGKYYKKASLGFILRDDIPLNNVACPTKLIEYLSNGIVPIVLSPNMGDFETLGYSYVTLEDYINGRVDFEAIVGAVKNNYKVIKKLEAVVDRGEKDLGKLIETLSTRRRKKVAPSLRKLVEFSLGIDQLQKDKEILETRLSESEVALRNSISLNAEYQDFIHKITHSKRWRVASAISAPLRSFHGRRNQI